MPELLDPMQSDASSCTPLSNTALVPNVTAAVPTQGQTALNPILVAETGDGPGGSRVVHEAILPPATGTTVLTAANWATLQSLMTSMERETNLERRRVENAEEGRDVPNRALSSC